MSNDLVETVCSNPGPSEFTVGNMDRFGNVLPTIIVNTNQEFNWRAYDFSDAFLSLLAAPSSMIQDAIRILVDSLIQAGLWEFYHAVYPLVNGNSTDHSLNLKYPFANQNSMKLQFIGSPIHDGNGVTMANTNQYCKLNMTPGVLEMYTTGHFSLYYRTHTANNNALEVSFSGDSREGRWFLNQPNAGAGTNGMSLCSNISQTHPAPELDLTGLWLLNRTSTTNLRQVRNGVLNRQIANNSSGPFYDGAAGTYSSILLCSGQKNAAFMSIGKGLSAIQEVDMFNIVQTFQTSLARAV